MNAYRAGTPLRSTPWLFLTGMVIRSLHCLTGLDHNRRYRTGQGERFLQVPGLFALGRSRNLMKLDFVFLTDRPHGPSG